MSVQYIYVFDQERGFDQKRLVGKEFILLAFGESQRGSNSA